MKKLKLVLNIVTILCVVLPLLFTVLIYRDNMLGLIIPPQVMDAMSGQSSMQEFLPDMNISDLHPAYNNDLQFNSDDNSFTFSFDINNPLNNTITINSIYFNLTDANGTVLGTIELNNPASLLPGENSTVSIGGALSQEFVDVLQSNGIDLSDPNFNPENLGGDIGFNPNELHITDVTLDIGGVQVHMDDLNLSDFLGSNNGTE